MHLKGLLAIPIAIVAMVVSIYICHSIVGELIVVNILDYYTQKRVLSGESVGFGEAVVVFLVVMGYMVVITLLILIASFSGWFYNQILKMEAITWQNIVGLFQVKEPD